MVIEKLIVKNFAAFKNAVNCNELTFHLDECKNKICLIIGPNGSGKTTLLSVLSPFADLGNLDIRNNQPLILKDKEGYKEIHIKNNDKKYIIKHIYTPHKDKSHSVKSYISLNGVELNPNGNVTSFKEMVKDELQIEPEYLKLIRLGSNVTSLISLTETERKNFMGKILDDIGIYLDYYKNVNNKLRQVKDTLNHTINKLNKLGIIDKSVIEKNIYDIKTDIARDSEINIKNHKQLAVYNYEIDDIKKEVGLENLNDFKDGLHHIRKKYDKLKLIIDQKESIKSNDIDFYKKEIERLTKEVESNSKDIESFQLIVENNLSIFDTLLEERKNLEIQERKESDTCNEINKLDLQLTDIRLSLRKSEDVLGEFVPKITIKEFEDFIVFLKRTKLSLEKVYEFGKKPIKKVVGLLKDGKNVDQYINNKISKLDDKIDASTALMLISRLNRSYMSGDNTMVFSCKNECSAKNLFLAIKNIIETTESEKDKNDIDFYKDMELVYRGLMMILPEFSNYLGIINSLPIDIKSDFTMTNIYERIINLEPIYNDEKINDLLSKFKEYDNYISNKNEYDRIEYMIKALESASNSKYIKDQIKKVNDSYDEKKESNAELIETINSLKETNIENNRTIEKYTDIVEALEKFEEISNRLNILETNYKYYLINLENIEKTTNYINVLESTINKKTDELNIMSNRLHDYEVLTKELKKLNKIYDEMTLVKNALSAKEGIPLKKIFRYLSDTENITNELLHLVYGDKIYIDKFEISSDAFRIPVYNRGFRINDVKYLSQGELSFVSIALAFALSSKTLRKYNIMLLDEVDGPLDTENRSKFIDIVENQIDRIESEQNFAITHNSMFSSYPVDIIDMSFGEPNNDYTLANYITVDRE